MNKQRKQNDDRAWVVFILFTTAIILLVWLMLIPALVKGGDDNAISWVIYSQECGCLQTYGSDRSIFQRLIYLKEPHSMAYDI